jgi:hypothetical protein
MYEYVCKSCNCRNRNINSRTNKDSQFKTKEMCAFWSFVQRRSLFYRYVQEIGTYVFYAMRDPDLISVVRRASNRAKYVRTLGRSRSSTPSVTKKNFHGEPIRKIEREAHQSLKVRDQRSRTFSKIKCCPADFLQF